MPSYTFSALPIPGTFGYGTVGLTWVANPPPTSHSVDVLKFVTNHPKFGTKLLNFGEFYGPDNANLKLVKAFLAENNDNAELIISVKGAIGADLVPDCSKENICRSIDNILTFFPPPGSPNRPKILYEPARVDLNVPYDQTISYIADYVQNGKIDGVSLSEVGIGSIQKALSVCPVSCVELELSLMCQDILHNGVVEELTKHGVPIIAYSPLSRGYLTDSTVARADTWLEELPADDIRHHLGTFSPENYKVNIVRVKELHKFAHEKKNCSLESLALSWIVALSENENYNGKKICKIIPIPGGSTQERIEKNLSSLVELTNDDLRAIDEISKSNPVQGLRYNEAAEKYLFA
ncbi:putative pyridoxal reductase [Diutina catenulata]